MKGGVVVIATLMDFFVFIEPMIQYHYYNNTISLWQYVSLLHNCIHQNRGVIINNYLNQIINMPPINYFSCHKSGI